MLVAHGLDQPNQLPLIGFKGLVVRGRWTAEEGDGAFFLELHRAKA